MISNIFKYENIDFINFLSRNGEDILLVPQMKVKNPVNTKIF